MELEQLNVMLANNNGYGSLLHCRSNGLYKLGELIGKSLLPDLTYPYALLEYAICLYYLNKKTEAFDMFHHVLNNHNLDKQTVDLVLFNMSFCIPEIKDRYLEYPAHIVSQIMVKPKKIKPFITFTVTSCKRFDLFWKTMNSFLNCCTDLSLIDQWICIDDNSSENDRQLMKSFYPFFEFYFKKPSEKGHPQSMNILLELTKESVYVWHQEDDWEFFVKNNYISRCLEVINSEKNIGQCLVNKNFAETEKDHDVFGGIPKETSRGSRYYIHTYYPAESEEAKNVNWKNSTYWPHYSLRVSLVRRDVLSQIGKYNEQVSHFEMDYAYRYIAKNYVSAFLEGISCYHIGRLTSERFDNVKKNAYELNDEAQFGGKEDKLKREEFFKSIKTYVLNLDRRPDRWKEFNDNAPSFPRERFSAVDGSKLINNHQMQQLFETNDFNWRKGIMGCALSHIKMWLEIEKSDKKFFMILEDDIKFASGFTDKLVKLVENTPEAWDVLFLGHFYYNEPSNVKQDQQPTAERWFQEKARAESMGGTIGYLITPTGARKLLDFINKTGVTNGIDWVMLKAIDRAVVTYYCLPHLIFSECWRGNNNPDSDIQFSHDSLKVDPDERLKQELDYFFSLGYSLDLESDNDDEKQIKFISQSDFKKLDENSIVIIMREKGDLNIGDIPHYEIGDKYVILIPKDIVTNRSFSRLPRSLQVEYCN